MHYKLLSVKSITLEILFGGTNTPCSGKHLKYGTPFTEPTFLPSGSSRAMPAQIPPANSVVPQNCSVPNLLPFTKTRSPICKREHYVITQFLQKIIDFRKLRTFKPNAFITLLPAVTVFLELIDMLLRFNPDSMMSWSGLPLDSNCLSFMIMSSTSSWGRVTSAKWR